MAAPFPEAQLEALIYMSLGSLLSLVVVLGLYARKLKQRLNNSLMDTEKESKDNLRVDNIGLSKKSQDLMSKILEEPKLQSQLPSELEVSKATVSNAVSELKEQSLIIRKKRANTYLIEPDNDELEKQQR
jgi:predicted transcriptional regulator